MQEIKDLLKQAGCTKEEIEVAAQAITLINGDHLEIYKHINALCKAQDDLNHTRSLIAQLDLMPPDKKRPYVRKQKVQPEASLIEKSGVRAASESLKEQQVEFETIIGPNGMPINLVKLPKEDKPKRQVRKRETDAEIKAAIEGDKDELTGAVRLSKEEAAANLTIDL